MSTLSENLDQQLIDLAWSLWTALGVVGVKCRHQNFLIAPEELILLTAIIVEKDPRLRDEALDWCTRYHHFISISRLRTLAKIFGPSIAEPFSIFAATLNSVSGAHWPLLVEAVPLKFVPSGKSKPPRFETPALLYFRLRALFGSGARADMIVFSLSQKKEDFSAADAVEIGYTKRNLADILENFVQAGIFDVFMVRNQRRYRFAQRDQMIKILEPFPEFMPSWRIILEVIVSLRDCIQRIEKKTESIKMVEIRNTLLNLENQLRRLNLTPPPMLSDFQAYWDSFVQWILGIVQSLAQGI